MNQTALYLDSAIKSSLNNIPERNLLANALSQWIDTIETTGWRIEDHVWLTEVVPIDTRAHAGVVYSRDFPELAFWLPLSPVVITREHVDAVFTVIVRYIGYLRGNADNLA